MANISLLEMGNTKKRGTREAIISILSREFPLSIKKIYNKVKKEYHSDLTYQAVFKLTKEMLADKILEKQEKEYKLNINWIKQLENELDIIKKNYLGKKQEDDSLQERINNFVAELGPKVKDYIGKDKVCVVGVSGSGFRYAMALWRYLIKEGVDVNFVELSKYALIRSGRVNFEAEKLENKKVIVVDYSILSGTTYKAIMDKLVQLKKKSNIKDIRYIVSHDSLGLADFSLEKK